MIDRSGAGSDSAYEQAPAGADAVEHPAHYVQGSIEVWDFILDQGLGFLEGNVVKYVCRHRYKGSSREDLLKARAYLDKLLAHGESVMAARDVA